MSPTHKRLIIVSDNAVRVQGDFGGGYTGPFTPGNQKARDNAILKALVYMPDAEIIGISDEDRERLNITAADKTAYVQIRDLPTELHKAAKHAAVDAGQSLNAWIIAAIRKALAAS